MALQLHYGTLAKWHPEKHWGFIRHDDGFDVFVHASGFKEKVAPPLNSRVKFSIIPNPQRPDRTKAIDVEVIVPKTVAVQRSASDTPEARHE